MSSVPHQPLPIGIEKEIDEIVNSVAEPNSKGWTGRWQAAEDAKSSLLALITRARKDELLDADDEIRLHNKVTGSYQEWFTKRLQELKNANND